MVQAFKNSSNLLSYKLSERSSTQLPSKLVRALLPGVRQFFSKEEFDKLDGSLRRGNIEILQSSILTEKLDRLRSGDLDWSTSSFQKLYQLQSFLKKYPIKGNDEACRKAAIVKLLAGESQCKDTNENIHTRLGLDTIHGRVREIIYKILGPLPSDFMTSTEVKFGPGSTVNPHNRKFSETSEFFKLTDKLYIPEKAKFFLAAHLSSNEGWVNGLADHYHINLNGRSRIQFEQEIFERHFIIVDDDFPNKLSYVEKNADEHRTIGVELNGLVILQMVLGNLIRKRLRNFGLNLNSQSRNKHMARLAKTFHLSTVDLANASNTLSKETVKAVLPYDWYIAMDTLRSSHGQVSDTKQIINYEMFSSMGNGFTFELESLIFYAIALATVEKDNPEFQRRQCQKNVAVFGDDVIVPQESYNNLVANMGLYGFRINDSKSFRNGRFFESCGCDFFDCTDVRPFFLKREIKTVRDIYFLCNSILFKSTKTMSDFLVPMYLVLLKELSQFPIQYGPLHFHMEKDGWMETNDDMESVLRVPLDYAQANGGVKFDFNLLAYKYKKWVRIAVEVPLSKNKQYAVQSARYLTFLRGALQGKAVLRGVSTVRLKWCSSSSWNGSLSRRELSLVDLFFNRHDTNNLQQDSTRLSSQMKQAV